MGHFSVVSHSILLYNFLFHCLLCFLLKWSDLGPWEPNTIFGSGCLTLLWGNSLVLRCYKRHLRERRYLGLLVVACSASFVIFVIYMFICINYLCISFFNCTRILWNNIVARFCLRFLDAGLRCSIESCICLDSMLLGKFSWGSYGFP